MPYKARREADGFYSITGVPVFAEVPKGVKGAPYDIDKDWLEAALSKSKVREKEGYLAPLHFEHHGGPDKSFKAGHYRLTRIGRVKIGGEMKFALYADFLKIPAHVMHSVMANEWPYRSVEIVRYQEHEIESVALLDDDSPFHKFELLNSDSIELDDDGDSTAREWQIAGPVAFAKTDAGYAGLFRFSEARMKFTVKPDGKGGFAAFGEDGKPAAGDIAGAEIAVEQHITFDKLPDDADELKKMAKAISAKLKQLAKCEDDDEEDENNPHKPADTDKGMKAGALDAATAARFDNLEREVNTMKAEKAQIGMVESAVAALKKDGYHVSDITRASIATYAATGKEALATFLADYRRLATKDGPETMGDAQEQNDDPFVAKFAAQGEAAHKAAVQCAAGFDSLVEAGLRRGTDDERKHFFKTYMTTRGFKAAS